jgi:hypothetical protein
VPTPQELVSGSAASVVANLGPCPTSPPLATLKTLNAGVQGLGRTLVPIDTARVRICRYGLNSLRATVRGKLEGGGALSGPVAAHIKDETNALHRADQAALSESPTGMSCPGPFYVTFANRLQNVSVTATGCDAVTNGVFLVFGSETWLSDLYRYTTDLPATAVVQAMPSVRRPT